MACDVTALMLYSIDALAEADVVSLANHVERCGNCRRQLTDREEFKAAIVASCKKAPAKKRTVDRRPVEPSSSGKRQSSRQI